MSSVECILFAYATCTLWASISNVNLRTLQSTWNVALYKIFRLKDLSNLIYAHYYTGILPVNYALDSRKLKFLQKHGTYHMTVMGVLFLLTGCKEFDLLYNSYAITNGRFCSDCVLRAFLCHFQVFRMAFSLGLL